jgi:hypothetical protein
MTENSGGAATEAPSISVTKLKIGRDAHQVTSLAEASRIFSDSVGDRGSSVMPNGKLYDAKGKQVAYISYNGKVWPGKSYETEAKPLYVPSYGSAA